MKPIFETFLGRLIVADAYYGLYRVNVESGSKEVLVPASLYIEGKKNLVTNSVAVTKDGKTIYFTTSRYSCTCSLYPKFLILIR
jgi:hypothetical protein